MLDIYELLRQAAEKDASDVHISVGVSPRFRVHGELVQTNFQKMTPSDTLEILLNLMTHDQREQFEEDGEIDLSVSIPQAGRYRVNAYKQRGSITLALRLVDMEIPDSDSLRIPEEVRELCNIPRGLIMVTGLSGSGKSTVIASLIDEINKTRACNIITLEDPIEYLHQHKKAMVNQREIGLDVKDYATALSAALKQDPDVLQVGTPDNAEDARLMLMAAETGRLVFSSMYTMSAVETIENLVDVFPEQMRDQARNRIANALKATISRQLLLATDGHRVPAYEIMFVDNKIRDIIRSGDIYKINDRIIAGAARGMISMDDYLLKLFKDGTISKKTAIQAAKDQENMESRLRVLE